jgi:hypothetical protein
MDKMGSARKLHLVGGAALLAALLAGCGEPKAPGEEPAAPASQPPQARAPAFVEIPEVKITAAAQPPPAAATSAAAPVTKPAAEPALASMQLAVPSAKLGVPVDLRYQFDSDARDGEPVTLHLAAVPRVAGSNLAMSIKQVQGIKATAEFRSRQAAAATPYREQLSVTRFAGGPAELRVLVTMDLPEGSAFSYFSVPVRGVPAAGKQAPVRME